MRSNCFRLGRTGGIAPGSQCSTKIKSMQKSIGGACLVGGVLLIVWGHNLAQSIGGQFQQAFTGSPGDKSMWLYIGGAVLCALGLFQIFSTKK